MPTTPRDAARFFRSRWFTRAARKAGITDAELCQAAKQVTDGQADDLGGGVYKKRLGGHRYRSIILARGGRFWVYEYLFAKQDRANIDAAELQAFRALAKGYEALTAPQLARLLNDKDLTEICHGDPSQGHQAQVQE